MVRSARRACNDLTYLIIMDAVRFVKVYFSGRWPAVFTNQSPQKYAPEKNRRRVKAGMGFPSATATTPISR